MHTDTCGSLLFFFMLNLHSYIIRFFSCFSMHKILAYISMRFFRLSSFAFFFINFISAFANKFDYLHTFAKKINFLTDVLYVFNNYITYICFMIYCKCKKMLTRAQEINPVHFIIFFII